MTLSLVDTNEHNPSDGWLSSIAKLDGDYFLIPYRGSANAAYIQAVRVYPTNGVINSIGSRWSFAGVLYNGGKMFTIPSTTIRGILFHWGDEVHLRTVDISNVGVITEAIISTAVLAASGSGEFSSDVVNVDGAGMHLFLYKGVGGDGFLQTRNIQNDGTIDAATDTWEFDAANCVSRSVYLKHISGTIYAVVYRGAAATTLFTVNVANNGVITHAFEDTLELEAAGNTIYPTMVNIVGGTKWVIMWKDLTTDLFKMVTVDIQNDGTIAAVITDLVTLDVGTQYYYKGCSIHFYATGQYVFFYGDGAWIYGKIYNIAVDGIIGASESAVQLGFGFSGYIHSVNYTGKQFVHGHGTNDYGYASYTGEAGVVTTQAMSDIGVMTAVGNGNITDLGEPDPTQHGHCWDTLPTPNIYDDKTELGAVAATGPFTSALIDLVPGVMYYVRAYVRTGDEVAYGNEVSFRAASLSSMSLGAAVLLT